MVDANTYKKRYKKKIDNDHDYNTIVQLADYLKLPIHKVLEFSVEEFMTWVVFLEDKRKHEQHQANVARMKAKSRR